MSDSKLKDIFVSVVIDKTLISYDIEKHITDLYKQLSTTYTHSEILILDDEYNHTYENILLDILKKVPRIRYIRLFGNKTQNQLIAAGLENAIGDIIVSLKSFDEILNLSQLVDNCCDGYDIVATTNRTSWLRLFSISYIAGLAISRRILNSVLQIQNTFEPWVCKQFYKHPISELLALNTNIKYIHSTFNTKSSMFLKALSEYYHMYLIKYSEKLGCINLGLFSIFVLSTIYMISSCISNEYFEIDILAKGAVIGTFVFNLYILKHIYAVSSFNGISNSIIYTVQFEKNSSVMLNLNELNIRTDSTSSTINLVQTGRNK